MEAISLLPPADPSLRPWTAGDYQASELSQLDPGEEASVSLAKPQGLDCRRSTLPRRKVSSELGEPEAGLPLWLSRICTRKLMYRMASRRISFLLSFFSGGWVGMSLRSSQKAALTLCWRQRSRVLVNTFLVMALEGDGSRGCWILFIYSQ